MALNAVCEDIRAMLNTDGKGVSGSDLFSFQWGSAVSGKEVDKQIMIRDLEPVDALIKDEYEQPYFQILVRGAAGESLKAVHDRARGIYEHMITQPRRTLNGTEYVQFAPSGGIIGQGMDGNNRAVYAMTFFTYRDSVDPTP